MSLVSAVRVMSWSMNCPQATSRIVTAWSWNPSSWDRRKIIGKRKEIQRVQIRLVDLWEGQAEQDLVEVSRDGPGRGKRVAGDGGARGGDAVRVVRGQEAVVAWGGDTANWGLHLGQN